MVKNKKKIEVVDNQVKIPCINCNPKTYLTFNFAYISYEKTASFNPNDIVKLWERMRWMSHNTYYNMVLQYGKDKNKWFENIPINQIKKEIPANFRKDFPSETNEKYSVMRVYPAGVPNGSSNPRIIGMIKHNIFYIFFLDWKGELYKHGS